MLAVKFSSILEFSKLDSKQAQMEYFKPFPYLGGGGTKHT
jgi:hypothetical protein